ncbi:hypothetical protein BY458DRAFT_498896 [Sporodiniella umbellata]|nr:hypothetical protein BY458DRAFT_498896 [Sporodiniella umbellata]
MSQVQEKTKKKRPKKSSAEKQSLQQSQQGQAQQSGNSSKMPSIRLDLNLEVEITLKARVHGDVTLALLS